MFQFSAPKSHSIEITPLWFPSRRPGEYGGPEALMLLFFSQPVPHRCSVGVLGMETKEGNDALAARGEGIDLAFMPAMRPEFLETRRWMLFAVPSHWRSFKLSVLATADAATGEPCEIAFSASAEKQKHLPPIMVGCDEEGFLLFKPNEIEGPVLGEVSAPYVENGGKRRVGPSELSAVEANAIEIQLREPRTDAPGKFNLRVRSPATTLAIRLDGYTEDTPIMQDRVAIIKRSEIAPFDPVPTPMTRSVDLLNIGNSQPVLATREPNADQFWPEQLAVGDIIAIVPAYKVPKIRIAASNPETGQLAFEDYAAPIHDDVRFADIFLFELDLDLKMLPFAIAGDGIDYGEPETSISTGNTQAEQKRGHSAIGNNQVPDLLIRALKGLVQNDDLFAPSVGLAAAYDHEDSLGFGLSAVAPSTTAFALLSARARMLERTLEIWGSLPAQRGNPAPQDKVADEDGTGDGQSTTTDIRQEASELISIERPDFVRRLLDPATEIALHGHQSSGRLKAVMGANYSTPPISEGLVSSLMVLFEDDVALGEVGVDSFRAKANAAERLGAITGLSRHDLRDKAISTLKQGFSFSTPDLTGFEEHDWAGIRATFADALGNPVVRWLLDYQANVLRERERLTEVVSRSDELRRSGNDTLSLDDLSFVENDLSLTSTLYAFQKVKEVFGAVEVPSDDRTLWRRQEKYVEHMPKHIKSRLFGTGWETWPLAVLALLHFNFGRPPEKDPEEDRDKSDTTDEPSDPHHIEGGDIPTDSHGEASFEAGQAHLDDQNAAHDSQQGGKSGAVGRSGGQQHTGRSYILTDPYGEVSLEAGQKYIDDARNAARVRTERAFVGLGEIELADTALRTAFDDAGRADETDRTDALRSLSATIAERAREEIQAIDQAKDVAFKSIVDTTPFNRQYQTIADAWGNFSSHYEALLAVQNADPSKRLRMLPRIDEAIKATTDFVDFANNFAASQAPEEATQN